MKTIKNLFASLAAFFITTSTALADSGNPIVDGTPCLAGTRCDNGEEDAFRTSIVDVISYLLTFVGLVAVIIFIYAGFLMLTGGGNDEQIQKGKKYMIWAVIGIIVILFSYMLVEFVIRAALGL